MGKRRFPNIPSRRAARSHPNRIVSILFFDLSTNNLTLTFGKGVDAALRGVFAQRSVMMMMMVILRRGRRFPHAAHQRQGAPDPSSSSSAASSTPAGGARRHSAALKHPEQPCRHVRLGHALIPRGQEGVLRPFPPLPPIHLSFRTPSPLLLFPQDPISRVFGDIDLYQLTSVPVHTDLAQCLVTIFTSCQGGTGFSSSSSLQYERGRLEFLLSLSLSRRRASRAISLATTRGLIYSRVTGTKRVNSLPPRYPTYTAEIFFTFFLAQCSMLQGHNHAFSPKKSRPIFTLLLLLLSLLTTRFGRFSFHENRDPLVTALPPEKNRCVVGWISLTVAMGQEMVSMVTAASEGCQQEWHGIRASIAPSPLDPDLRTADGHFGSACSAAGCARLRR